MTPAVGTAPPLARRVLVAGVAALSVLVLVVGVMALLRPREVVVTISSIPTGAQVTVDGVSQGETPVVMKLKSGAPPAQVRLRKAGYLEAVRPLLAKQGPELLVKLTAKPTPEKSAEEDEGGDKAGARPAVPDKAAPLPTQGEAAKTGPAKTEPAAKSEPAGKAAADDQAAKAERSKRRGAASKPASKPKGGVVVPF
jgi:hypothetical protein